MFFLIVLQKIFNMIKYENIAKIKFGRPIKTTSKEIIFTCPKCKRDKLYVSKDKGLFLCFRCNYKGKLKVKTKLIDLKNDFVKDKEIQSYSDNQLSLVSFESKPLTEKQIQALKDRGLTDSDISYYHICGRTSDNRIQIPNYVKYSFTDIICAWEYDKSKVNKSNPKYLITGNIEKSKTLFNIYNIDSDVEQIILCEGIFNAITAGKNAVASFGCVCSDRQIDLMLEKEPKSILIAYDSDEPGVLGSLDVINKLKAKKYKGVVEYILLPLGIDINDLGRENFKAYYNSNKIIIDLNSPTSIKLPILLFKNKK